MSTLVSSATCEGCSAELGAGLLVCPGCARLIHRERLTGLAAEASRLEQEGDLAGTLGTWRDALALLPGNTQQHTTISKRMQQLSAAIDGRGPAPEGVAQPAKPGRAGRAAAGAGLVGLTLLKSKALLGLLLANGKLLLAGLIKLPTLLSMLLYARWTSGSGVGLGLGLVASIYVHEMGHVAALRRYGIAASAPMFVPGLGAFVRLNQYPTDAHEEARTGLAGPLWGCGAALLTALCGTLLDSATLTSIASIAASINLFNLIPVWQLDGARGLHALHQGERFAIAGVFLLSALALHQWLPAIAGAVTLARAFGAGGPAHPTGDRRMAYLFAALITLLALTAALPVVLPRHR